jgi:hypothetical protein
VNIKGKPIKWKVGRAPTGPWRAFERRSWPDAMVEGNPVARLTCRESYTPKIAEDCEKPIELWVAKWYPPESGKPFEWLKFRTPFHKVSDAKAFFKRWCETNPNYFEHLEIR